jgi:hypothetical protein
MEIISKEALKDFYYNEFSELLNEDEKKGALIEFMARNGYNETLVRVNNGEFNSLCTDTEHSFKELVALI